MLQENGSAGHYQGWTGLGSRSCASNAPHQQFDQVGSPVELMVVVPDPKQWSTRQTLGAWACCYGLQIIDHFGTNPLGSEHMRNGEMQQSP